ncbi:ABC1 kinase family protein [Hamadaea tsunoensis]|uniref:ABC1 kinase family protein n=1 Tax=Hamadaea tsunoensis TaxID=53368 RepID=UPI000419A63E|nr:AarF/ABC1/UbiB kinase family protein [Hamadaea tsunoensis]
MTEIPRRAVARTAKLASLPLGFAGRTVLGFGKRVTGMAADVVAAGIQERTAEQLFSVLGQLKGGAMKLGQALSVFEAALPEELAGPYRQALTKLQEAAPPLPAASVHKVLAGQLGEDWRSLFVSFDDHPAAAASIGQVHRAVWKLPRRRAGLPVAVKVQYPGAGDALIADLAQLARFSALFGVIQPGLDVKPLVAELRERVVEELDYDLEAASQTAFAEAYADDKEFYIPRVLKSSPRVLVTEWVEGQPISAVINSGTVGDRDRAGQLLATFAFSAPARAGMLHADPHPGNFRLLPDGRLGVIDFGAVARLPGGLPAPIGRLTRLALAGDADAVLTGLRDEGFVKPDVDIDAAAILDWIQPMLEPLRAEEFRFTRSWLRGEAARIASPRSPAYAMGRQLNLPPAYLMIQRVTMGTIGVLCQLEAKAHYGEIITSYLPGYEEE